MQMEGWLSGGDLRSDGSSNEVVEFVLANHHALEDLVAALDSEDPVVRGRAADALEKVGRSLPDQVSDHISEVMHKARTDDVPMVRWHLAMLLGHLLVHQGQRVSIETVLLKMLEDDSVFVVSWVISSLALLALLEPSRQPAILAAIGPFEGSDSTALRTRASNALAGLTDPSRHLPDSWIKSPHIRKALAG